MANSEHFTTEVDTDWIFRVRSLLYDLAHETGRRAVEAECLGSYIPGFLEKDKADEPLQTQSDRSH